MQSDSVVLVQAAKVPEDLIAEGMAIVVSTKDAVVGSEAPKAAAAV